MTRRAALGRGALVLLLLIAAPAVAEARAPGELRVALPWTPENLDPTMNLSSIRAKVGVLQLRLRRGVVFHDGEPFNAEAVRFTFERVLDPNQRHLRDRRPRDLDAAYGPVAAAPRGHPPVGLHREVLTRAANRS